MPNQLKHGCYGQDAPEGVHQHRYMGGGHGGCGGYVEALELETLYGPVFLLHEYRTDINGRRWRWRIFLDGPALLDAWNRAYSLSITGEGFSPWETAPFWEAVDYQAQDVTRGLPA